MGFFHKISEGLKKTRGSLGNALNSVISNFRKVDEEFFEELEEVLITCDMGANTAFVLCENLRKRVKTENIQDAQEIKSILQQEIAEILTLFPAHPECSLSLHAYANFRKAQKRC